VLCLQQKAEKGRGRGKGNCQNCQNRVIAKIEKTKAVHHKGHEGTQRSKDKPTRIAGTLTSHVVARRKRMALMIG
jgi:hypothetical protein